MKHNDLRQMKCFNFAVTILSFNIYIHIYDKYYIKYIYNIYIYNIIYIKYMIYIFI